MSTEVAWILVSLGTDVQPQILFDPNYLPDYLSVSYDYGDSKKVGKNISLFDLILRYY